MDKNVLSAQSKFLSYLLRHKPESLHLTMDAHGWVSIDQLIENSIPSDTPLTRAQLEDIVRNCTKQRFAISADGGNIRANQGHSVPVDLDLSPCLPPEKLYHGTAEKNLLAIQASGLNRHARHHVHLSSDPETARKVGMRHGKPIVFTVQASVMQTHGHQFFLTDNGVWLIESVPPEFLQL
ncbi:RNA 2'-phosphotransferase [Parasedimentitalea marina]|uniref:Probable RNA 2'-phosphotransferase n=1 Tax=Parasedimentitalea marina TaxID=2483033 RepID=A0A3T0N442_9RHOB|nr:RNA 2'-phosphotransferase [Parasedimentitalea marina]AZV78764.1 RNA 2'-phosphotransferase [Parasedimentitalea marina]